MTYCGERVLATIEDGVHHAVSLKCRSWGCPDCAPDRRRQLIAKGISGQPNKFITLTSKRDRSKTPVEAARELVQAWRHIARLYRKEHAGAKIEFIAVFESTKLGWPHLHILARCLYIGQKWLSEQMDKLTGSPVVWIEAVSGQKKIASYVAKYAGKEPHKFATLKRYWQSHHYEIDKPEKRKSNSTWQVLKMNLAQWMLAKQCQGLWPTLLTVKHATAVRLC